ncbi:MAG: phosphoglucosamine mutase [bacterium]|nr:phosphoglucosamine mutase [bacterium]
MDEPIISVSGLRGIVGESLTPEVAMKYAAAFASQAPAGEIIVSRDGRTTGEMLACAIRAALSACGRSVVDIGIAATPTVGVAVNNRGAAGAIQITASHNPPPYNGMKLFSADGRVLTAAVGEGVLTSYRNNPVNWAAFDAIGTLETIADNDALHLERVMAIADVDRVAAKSYRVNLDSNHGSGAVLGAKLLNKLGCQTTIAGAEPTGLFIHRPEPNEENLKEVAAQSKKTQADVTFCQDPDADRLAIIDENGHYIGEEYTLAICVKYVLSQTPGPVVTNCSTSRMTEDLAIAAGVPFSRSAVGEANVVEEMIKAGAVFGGEGNGGPIDPRVVFVRDSFVGMALVLSAMAVSNKTVSQLVAEIPRYAIYKTKAPLERDSLSIAYDALARHFSDATTDRLDGLRLDWPDAWLLVRPSNTEPIVRAFAEAPTAERAAKLGQEAEALLNRISEAK